MTNKDFDNFVALSPEHRICVLPCTFPQYFMLYFL